MFITLINNVAAAAQQVLNAPNLPPAAQSLRAHAAAFPSQIAPKLQALAGQSIEVAQMCGSEITTLQPLLDAWKGGNAAAHDAILNNLQGLLTRVRGVTNADADAFKSLSGYRDQVLTDQRTVAQLINQLQAQMAGLRSQLNDAAGDLSKERQRLAILHAIPFPLPWVIAEIASLISSSKTLEQRISELQGQFYALNGQAAQVDHAQSVVQGFGGQLEILENSMQNLINAISVTQSQVMQLVTTLQSGSQVGTPLLVEAYLRSLQQQAQSVVDYLDR